MLEFLWAWSHHWDVLIGIVIWIGLLAWAGRRSPPGQRKEEHWPFGGLRREDEPEE